jgi:hypothetical protein
MLQYVMHAIGMQQFGQAWLNEYLTCAACVVGHAKPMIGRFGVA